MRKPTNRPHIPNMFNVFGAVVACRFNLLMIVFIYIAVCCSVLWCVVVCYSVWQLSSLMAVYVYMYIYMLQCVAVCCSQVVVG